MKNFVKFQVRVHCTTTAATPTKPRFTMATCTITVVATATDTITLTAIITPIWDRRLRLPPYDSCEAEKLPG